MALRAWVARRDDDTGFSETVAPDLASGRLRMRPDLGHASVTLITSAGMAKRKLRQRSRDKTVTLLGQVLENDVGYDSRACTNSVAGSGTSGLEVVAEASPDRWSMNPRVRIDFDVASGDRNRSSRLGNLILFKS